jgi:hypothetical protein
MRVFCTRRHLTPLRHDGQLDALRAQAARADAAHASVGDMGKHISELRAHVEARVANLATRQ